MSRPTSNPRDEGKVRAWTESNLRQATSRLAVDKQRWWLTMGWINRCGRIDSAMLALQRKHMVCIALQPAMYCESLDQLLLRLYFNLLTKYFGEFLGMRTRALWASRQFTFKLHVKDLWRDALSQLNPLRRPCQAQEPFKWWVTLCTEIFIMHT